MKIHTLSSALALTCILIACKSSSPILRDVSRGVQDVDKTVNEVNKVANNVQRTKENIDRARGKQPSTSQTSQRGNRSPENTRNSGRRGSQSRPEKGDSFAKCISGDCENGFGKMQFDEETYEGQFKNGFPDGKGKTVMNSGIKYDGEYSKGKFHGNVTRVDPDGTVFRGVYVEGAINGFGVRTRDGLPVYAYFNRYMMQDYYRQLTMPQLKYHQDTTYARFKKCNCLARKDFSIPTAEWVDVEYDVINGYGAKVGETTKSDLKFSSIQVKGYVNNTNHDIYIRAYRKHYFEKRQVYEYIDDSYVVKPGKEVMGNFRRKPGDSALRDYFAENYVFLGQYCGKNAAPCKPVAKSK